MNVVYSSVNSPSCCVASGVVLLCSCYRRAAAVTTVMQLLPLYCSCYRCTTAVKLLPFYCSYCRCTAVVTAVLQLLPLYCSCYLCTAAVTAVLQLFLQLQYQRTRVFFRVDFTCRGINTCLYMIRLF